jgi:hypothetical protein
VRGLLSPDARRQARATELAVSADQHDAGGKTRLPLLPRVRGDALFVGERSEHRLWLSRWMPDEPNNGCVLCCGMNPSTAGADMDDLTVRKDWSFTRRWGYAALYKVNVGSYASTDPDGMSQPGVLVNHPDNHPYIRTLAADAALIVMAIGDPPDVLMPHARSLVRMLKADGRAMMCLGTTKSGWPKHTSRLSYNVPLTEWRP